MSTLFCGSRNTRESQIADTLLAVQLECIRLEKENAHLKAELDLARGWIAKYEEKLDGTR